MIAHKSDSKHKLVMTVQYNYDNGHFLKISLIEGTQTWHSQTYQPHVGNQN